MSQGSSVRENIKTADYVEGSDSSAAQTRALAAALAGKHFDMYSLGLAGRSAVRMFPLVPDWALGIASRFASGNVGVSRARAADVRTEDMAQWVVSKYPAKKYDAIILGAPSGGVSHIGSIMNAPFLTTHFLICFRDIRHVDDVFSTFSTARKLSRAITRNNRDLHVVGHYDPVHDRPVLLFINHLRAKLLELPETYKRFIKENLAPGGELLLIDCSYPWLQYRMSGRASFQIGGLGGVSDREFIDGSARIDEYLRSQGSFARGGWGLESKKESLVSMPESEWGSMPQFAESAREFADSEKIPLKIISGHHPEQFSELAFEMHMEASRRDGVEPLHFFADCFNQLDPVSNLNSRIIPLWLPYYCDSSFRFAGRMLEKIPGDMRALLTLHPSLAEPFDMVPLERWVELFARDEKPLLIGIDPEKFPADLTYIYDFGAQLRNYCAKHRDPVRARLSAADAADIASRTLTADSG